MTTETKERGMLFSSAMVRALLAGTKTMTRRIAKFSDIDGDIPNLVVEPYPGEWIAWWTDQTQDQALEFSRQQYDKGEGVLCPYGRVGDRIWVRETWSPDHQSFYPHWPIVFAADYPDPEEPRRDDPAGKFRWRPSIHMPRHLSRLTLEITDIRVQRLQEISPADIVAEGMPDRPAGEWSGVPVGQRDLAAHDLGDTDGAVEWYADLWESLGGSWDANPWIWAVAFKKLEGDKK